MNTTFEVYFTSRIKFGKGCLNSLGEDLKERQLKRCLIITDEGIMKTGFVEKIQFVLKENGIETEIFSKVEPNPGTRLVNEGTKVFLAGKFDFLVSVGGGSPIDTAKAIGILSRNGGEIMDYEGAGKVGQPLPYHVAIPTTYGSGSEVTSFTVITDEKRKFKAAIGSPYIIPRIAYIEPELMAALPKGIGASVGLDALCHAIESYVSKFANPFSQGLAFKSIRMIFQNIKLAVGRKDAIEPVLNMGIASAMAGMAFSQSRLGIVHAMAHPLGGHYDIPHGVANALLLPYCMEFNLSAVPERFAEIAEAMQVVKDTDNKETKGKKSIDAVRELQNYFDIPSRMRKLGVKEDHIPQMAKDTMLSGNIKANPRETSYEDIVGLYTKCL